jgi:uncharacterized GH25 family protein
MDTDFINAFIDKQRKLIEELVSKNLLSEAKITILEKKVSDLSSQLEAQTLQSSKKEKVKYDENISNQSSD